MHVLLLPPCSSFSPFAAGHPSFASNGLEKFVSGAKTGGAESQPYLSPPMSDAPLSPRRTRARETVDHQPSAEPAGHRRRSLERLFPAARVPASSATEQRALPAPQHHQHHHPEHRFAPRRETRSSHPETLSSVSISAQQTRPFEFPRQYATIGHGGPVAIQSPGNPFVTPGPHQSPRGARRNKAHVASACVNCKKAHLSCDVQRPCTRCVASGKEATCYDVQHKKRGRPRLRDAAVSARSQEGAESAEPFPATAAPLPSTASSMISRPRAGSLRTLRSGGRRATLGSAQTPRSVQPTIGELAVQHWTPPVPLPSRRPFALLDLDFTLLKTNQVFNELFGSGAPMAGRALTDIVEPGLRENLQRLRADLREERDAREPAYMAPIFGPRDHEAVQDVEEMDLDRISAGYDDRSQTWRMRFSHAPSQDVDVRVRLAKTNIFFVSLVLPPVPSQPQQHQTQTQQQNHPSASTSDPRPHPQPPASIHSSRPASSLSRRPPSSDYTFSPYALSSPRGPSEPASPYSPYFSLHSVPSSLASAGQGSPAYSFGSLPLAAGAGAGAEGYGVVYPGPGTGVGVGAGLRQGQGAGAGSSTATGLAQAQGQGPAQGVLLSPYQQHSHPQHHSQYHAHSPYQPHAHARDRERDNLYRADAPEYEYRYAQPRSSGALAVEQGSGSSAGTGTGSAGARGQGLSLLLEGREGRTERERTGESESGEEGRNRDRGRGTEGGGKRRRLNIRDVLD